MGLIFKGFGESSLFQWRSKKEVRDLFNGQNSISSFDESAANLEAIDDAVVINIVAGCLEEFLTKIG